MRTSKVLGAFLAILTLAWVTDVFIRQPAPAGAWPWVVRQQGLYLTGLWSVGLMSLVMMLALRPRWIEAPLGGMDKAYHLHKWAGILAIATGAAHWLLKLASSPLKALIGSASRPARDATLAALAGSRGLAKDMGEWALYVLLAMLAITLWRRFPYHAWRLLHRAMPVLFLALVFHACALTPAFYWLRPTGVMLALLMAGGAWAALVALAGRIGRRRKFAGTVVSVVRRADDVLEIACDPGPAWPGHQAGQFAFLTLDRREGAHPFTIASAASAPQTRRIVFQVKALGDYTRRLADRLQAGRAVTIEGPYGRFERPASTSGTPQIWVAGGIGITPFLAWLEALQADPGSAPRAHLHYCVRDRTTDPFVDQLHALCAPLPGIRLHVHSASDGEILSAEALGLEGGNGEVWFCGPTGLSQALRRGLRRLGHARVRFHQEAFEMR